MFETIKMKLNADKAKRVGLTVSVAAREIGQEVVEHAALHHAMVYVLRI
jgi:hypothetical protein